MIESVDDDCVKIVVSEDIGRVAKASEQKKEEYEVEGFWHSMVL